MMRETSLQFAGFRLEPNNARLWRGAHAIKLKPKAFVVLHYLVEHAGQLVTKDDLWQAVWPDVTVSDDVLTACVRDIRKALADDAKTPRFIETVHRRGYRFIALLTPAPPVSSSRFQVSGSDTQHSGLSTQHSVLVGREAELAQLHHWLDKALNGERQIVFVTGEPGIGKTSLVEAFLARLASSHGYGHEHEHEHELWIGRGQCIEHYGAGEAYLPLLEALGRLGRAPGGARWQSRDRERKGLHRCARVWPPTGLQGQRCTDRIFLPGWPRRMEKQVKSKQG